MAHFGNFYGRSDTDLAFGVLDANKAISVQFEHKGSLSAREYAHIQCALLYTSLDGKRRVRTINLAVQVADLAGNVFRNADMDAVVCHLSKEGSCVQSGNISLTLTCRWVLQQ